MKAGLDWMSDSELEAAQAEEGQETENKPPTQELDPKVLQTLRRYDMRELGDEATKDDEKRQQVEVGTSLGGSVEDSSESMNECADPELACMSDM